jgi:hypothetical protein
MIVRATVRGGMMKRVLVVGMMLTLGALALPSTALAAWSDCPPPFDGQSCTVGLNPVCYHNGTQIQCDLGTYGDLLYAVDDGTGDPYAYGYIGTAGPIDKFCCTPTELGGSVTPILVYAGTGADEICLVDDTVHHCDDNDGTGAQVWTDDSEIWTDSGNDKIDTATTGDYIDWIDSGNDNDLVSTYGDDDEVYLGEGDDIAYLGDGDDICDANDGADTVYGQNGADDICLGGGADYGYGGNQDDCVCSGADSGVNGNIDGALDYMDGGNPNPGDTVYYHTGGTANNFTGGGFNPTCGCACPY